MKTIDELATQLVDSSFFLEEAVELLEIGMVEAVMLRTKGNLSEGSKMLGIHRNTLVRKMTEYRIDSPRRKGPSRRRGHIPVPVESSATSFKLMQKLLKDGSLGQLQGFIIETVRLYLGKPKSGEKPLKPQRSPRRRKASK